jgi:hypothetical protein
VNYPPPREEVPVAERFVPLKHTLQHSLKYYNTLEPGMYSFFSSLRPASCYLSSILLLPTQCYSKYSLSSMALPLIDCMLRGY